MFVHQPSVMEFGALQLISPDGSHRIEGGLWPELAAAVLLEPEPELLATWVGRLEVGLGVNPAHRRALETSVETVLEESREQKRRRLLERSQQAARAGAQLRDPARVQAIEKKASELAQLLAAPPDGEGRKLRSATKLWKQRAQTLQSDLEAERQKERDQVALYGVAGDAILRAQLRGDDVQAYEAETADFALDSYGARILNEDGLPALVYGKGLRARKLNGVDHAFDAGYLRGERGDLAAEILFRIGLNYREAYVIAEGQVSNGGGEGGGGFGPKAPQPRVIEAGELLDDMRSLLTPRERYVLDEVCGKDRRTREVADAMGAGFPATAKALRTGLRQASEGRRLAIERRKALGVERVGARVRAAVLAFRGAI